MPVPKSPCLVELVLSLLLHAARPRHKAARAVVESFIGTSNSSFPGQNLEREWRYAEGLLGKSRPPAPTMTPTIPEIKSHMDLSVGFPLKNRDISEPTESLAEMPNTRSITPTAKMIRPNMRVMELLLNNGFDATSDDSTNSDFDGSA